MFGCVSGYGRVHRVSLGAAEHLVLKLIGVATGVAVAGRPRRMRARSIVFWISLGFKAPPRTPRKSAASGSTGQGQSRT